MLLAGDTLASVRFSTERLPSHRRPAVYREMLGRSVGSFEVEAVADEFNLSAETFALPGLSIAHIASSAVRAERKREMAMDDSRDLTLAVCHDGTVTMAQRGREVTLKNGGAYLFSTHEPLLMQRSSLRVTSFSVLKNDLAPMVSDLGAALPSAIPLESEAIRLLTGYTDLVFRDGAPASADFRRLAVSHIHDLIALAIGASRDAQETAKTRGLRAARHADLYARAGRLIALRFDDPDLTANEIAHRLGVSRSLLHRIFAERSETVMARLWEERVNRAARLVAAPQAADRSLTDIAFACGFNDSAHFTRAFATRMGMAPSHWRKRARELSEQLPPDVSLAGRH